MTDLINFHGFLMTAAEAQAEAQAIMAGFDDLTVEDRDTLNYTERLGHLAVREISKNTLRQLRREMAEPRPWWRP